MERIITKVINNNVLFEWFSKIKLCNYIDMDSNLGTIEPDWHLKILIGKTLCNGIFF